MLRNGDGHLKNFGLLYDEGKVWLAPVYDVVTTTIYKYERSLGVFVTDRTMALKLRRGEKHKPYPALDELLSFGRDVCGVASPSEVVARIAQAMDEVLANARADDRIAPETLRAATEEWLASIETYAGGGSTGSSPSSRPRRRNRKVLAR